MSEPAGAIGFDIGGQSVKAVRVSADGVVLAHDTAPTGPATSPQNLGRLLDGLRVRLLDGDGRGVPIGVGIAGVLDRGGALRGGPHLPLLVGEPIAPLLADALASPVAVHNDADCAAMAEGWTGGAAASIDDFLMIAIGTGVGSGLVLGGRVRAGASGYGCEFGHMTIAMGGRPCGCGNRGCVEAYISETAAGRLVGEGPAALQARIAARREAAGGGFAQAVFELGAAGDDAAETIAGEMVDALGAAIGSAVNVLDLTTIVLGGGIAPGVLARVSRLLRAAAGTLFARTASDLRILAAARGPLAGAIGAARLGMMASSPR